MRVSMLFPGTNAGKVQAQVFADGLNNATAHLCHLGACACVVTDWNAEDYARGHGMASRIDHHRVVWTPIEGLTPMHGMSEYAAQRAAKWRN